MKKQEVRIAALETAREFLSVPDNNYQYLVDTFNLKVKDYYLGEATDISGKTESGLKLKLNDEGKLKISFDKEKVLSINTGKKLFRELAELVHDKDRNGINDDYEESLGDNDSEDELEPIEDDYGEAIDDPEDEYER